jgi:hypothetical protein
VKNEQKKFAANPQVNLSEYEPTLLGPELASTSTAEKLGSPPDPSPREKNERKKERMLAFVVSSVLYGVQVPVEMRVEPTVFSNRVNPFLLEAWNEAALKSDPSPKRSGKIQRALERSMVLYIVDAKHRKPDQQLTLKTQPTSYNPVYRVCPATLGEINAAKCASCTHAYGCNFYTYKTKGGP